MFSKNEAEQTKAESIMEDHMESNRVGNYTSHKENWLTEKWDCVFISRKVIIDWTGQSKVL